MRTERSFKVLESLKSAILQSWDLLRDEMIRLHIDLMRKRFKLVIRCSQNALLRRCFTCFNAPLRSEHLFWLHYLPAFYSES